jgi:hypothetical protein
MIGHLVNKRRGRRGRNVLFFVPKKNHFVHKSCLELVLSNLMRILYIPFVPEMFSRCSRLNPKYDALLPLSLDLFCLSEAKAFAEISCKSNPTFVHPNKNQTTSTQLQNNFTNACLARPVCIKVGSQHDSSLFQ